VLPNEDDPLLYPIKQTYPAGLASPLEMINRYCTRLYEESLSEPEYVFLNEQDYHNLREEIIFMIRWVKTEQAEQSKVTIRERTWLKVFNPVTGREILASTLPDMPRAPEFSRAHLTFAHWQHRRLPILGQGEIIALCSSDTEKLLDLMHGKKS
jgi:hypothetical protein